MVRVYDQLRIQGFGWIYRCFCSVWLFANPFFVKLFSNHCLIYFNLKHNQISYMRKNSYKGFILGLFYLSMNIALILLFCYIYCLWKLMVIIVYGRSIFFFIVLSNVLHAKPNFEKIPKVAGNALWLVCLDPLCCTSNTGFRLFEIITVQDLLRVYLHQTITKHFLACWSCPFTSSQILLTLSNISYWFSVWHFRTEYSAHFSNHNGLHIISLKCMMHYYFSIQCRVFTYKISNKSENIYVVVFLLYSHKQIHAERITTTQW